LEGKIEDVIQACIGQDQQEKLEQMASSPTTADALI